LGTRRERSRQHGLADFWVIGRSAVIPHDDVSAMHAIILRQKKREAVHQRIAADRIERPLFARDARRQPIDPAVIARTSAGRSSICKSYARVGKANATIVSIRF
jgi:hypothetical protein